MNDKTNKPGKALTVQDRAVAALGLATLAKDLKELAKGSTNLIEIKDQASYQQIHSARMVLKNQRVEIAKRGKAARDDANQFAKAVIEEEKKLIGIIQPEEERLQSLQNEFNEREERERQAKVEAEQQRVEGHQQAIANIRGAVSAVQMIVNPTAAQISKYLDSVKSVVVDASFEEFKQQAEEAKAATVATLTRIHDSIVQREAEQAELDKLRREKEERDRADRQAREAAEAEARKKREAEEQAERKRLDAQRQEQEQREAVIKAEEDRLRQQREEQERRAREEADRKEAERKADEKRRVDAEAAAKKAKFPGEAAIVTALVEYFKVPAQVAEKWVAELKKAK